MARVREWAAVVRQRRVGAWWLTPLAVFAASRVMVWFVWWVLSERPAEPKSPLGMAGGWDGGWYTRIARWGYVELPLGDGVVHPLQQLAFFPVVPFGARAIHEVTSLDIVLAGVLQSLVAGALAVVLIWRLVEQRFDREIATASVTMLVLSPPAFVLSMFYTEAVTLLLVAVCFVALERRRWWLVAAVCLVAGLTRPTAALLAVPVAVVLWQERRRTGRWAPGGVLALVAAPAGFVAWIAYVGHRMGRWDGYFHLQREAWGSRLDAGWSTLGNIVRTVTLRPESINHMVNAVGMVLIGLVGVALVLRTSMPATWRWFAVATVALTFANGLQVSSVRYLLPAFPLFVAWMARTSRDLRPLVIGMGATLMGAGMVISQTTGLLTP